MDALEIKQITDEFKNSIGLTESVEDTLEEFLDWLGDPAWSIVELTGLKVGNEFDMTKSHLALVCTCGYTIDFYHSKFNIPNRIYHAEEYLELWSEASVRQIELVNEFKV